MWKKLQVAQKALGDAQSRLVIADGRINQSVGDDGMTYVAAKEALKALEEEIAKAADALKEINDTFRMHPDTGGTVYSMRKGGDGIWAPPPTEESGGDEQPGESNPTVSPVPRPVPRPSRSCGNERGAPDPEDSGGAEVGNMAPLAAVSFDFGRRDESTT